MRLISCEELKAKLDSGSPLKLVNALERPKFLAKHIPGSLNLFTKDEILQNLSKEDEIIVYCSDQACNKSIILYYLLDALGYQKVWRFAGGLTEWERMGLPLEGEAALP